MKRCLIILAFLLLASCIRQDQQDWLIGKWNLSSCTYVNFKTGETGTIRDAGFKSWEFTEKGTVIIDGYIVGDYWHRDGQICVQSTIYDEVANGRDRMTLEHRSLYAVTTYIFSR